jgi:hypothetical protein
MEALFPQLVRRLAVRPAALTSSEGDEGAVGIRALVSPAGVADKSTAEVADLGDGW